MSAPRKYSCLKTPWRCTHCMRTFDSCDSPAETYAHPVTKTQIWQCNDCYDRDRRELSDCISDHRSAEHEEPDEFDGDMDDEEGAI